MELYNQLLVEKVDESFLKIHCLQHVKLLLSEYFKITPPNVDGMRFGMSKNWDGKISLFDGRSKKLPIGLFPYLIDFAKDNDLKLITEGMNWYLKPKKITDDDLRPFIKFLNLPFVPYKYQVEALRSTISNQRRTFLSPTSSGKSLIAYMLVRFFKDKKILLICPTINLVRQMAGDWKEYSEENGWDTDADTHQIAEGASRESDKRIHISTWQALQNMPKDFFHQYDMVIGDEVHGYDAKTLKFILNNCVNASVRVGMTGTLKGTQSNKLTIEGLFGPCQRLTTTQRLIKAGRISKLNIKVIIFEYEDGVADAYKTDGKLTYQDEVEFLCAYQPRNEFLKKLLISQMVEDHNSLLLYQRVESHGLVLDEMLRESYDPDKVFTIHGKILGKKRDEIRKQINEMDNAILTASYGTFSMGANLPRLHNLIFGFPSKSRVKVLQSIGRGLRKGHNKDLCNLFDIADNLQVNYTMDHLSERIKYYIEEGHEYKILRIPLKDNNKKGTLDG